MLVHPLVEAQARRAPGAPALVCGGVRLSYAELEAQANRLARALRRRGVGPEALVGLAAERSPETIVALLAVLKAGGAYVPLDPSYPPERLAYMWGDASRPRPGGAAPVLLVQERTAGAVAAHGVAVLRLDTDSALWADESAEPLAAAETGVTPDNLAYVIYTSGSTGRPKGVPIAHRGVVNVVRESARLLGVRPESRVLQLASLSFDASVLEIFTALSTGACLVLTPRETLLSGEALGRELAARRITTIAIPPSLLDKVPEGVELPELRSIVVGGEACSAATAARWARGRRFVNAYAPTEATIFATAGAWQGEGGADGAPSIGVPIADTIVELLDEQGEPVPPGEPGEICLGGVGLARGYLHRPDLTAERFIPAARGARLYRSGDLGRLRPDGSLEFIGRVDFQVKVRGFRIELGEIEAVLCEHSAVRSAVVVAREDALEPRGADKRLVAYVVPRATGEGLVSTLRAHLARRLPDYMVPAGFVFLDALPMAATGKVDRKALPAPGGERPELATAYAAPSAPGEEALARIWGELLGLDRVGVQDNLFALGGHSLLVAQIVNRVRQETGVELSIAEVFERPTIAALAERLAAAAEEGPRREPALELPPIEPALRDRPLPLSFTQERVWFLDQLSPGAIAYNFQFTLRFAGPLDAAALARALAEIVRRHEVLRTTFPALDGRGVQIVHPPFAVELPVVDLTALPPEEREARAERLVHAEIRRGFDVARLPLLRWTLYRFAPDDHLLLQVEHHFVHDGWSLALFLRELKEIYTAFAAGRPSPLPEPPIQYGDFAVWQRRFLAGPVLARQLAYWKERLGDDPPVLQMPADYPRPKAHSFRGDALRVDLPHGLYEAVRAAARREGVTLFVTMLAAFDALLYRMTGQEDFLLGSGVANRRLRETEEMIGMVVNTVVLRTPLGGGLPFRDLLARARRTMLEAHEHQDLPFEKLVQELQPDRDLSRNPLFQVLFSFHDAPVPDLDFGAVAAEIFERHNGSAKSDLNVVVKPRAEQRVGRRPTGRDELTMVWEFATDLYERATVERMWRHYQNLLRGVVEDAGRTLAELPLLSPAERLQLAAWNETGTPAPAEPRVHRLVELQAAVAPERLAVSMGARRLDYGALNAAANRLARKLRALGVGLETPVGVLLERSPELVIAELAAIKAGGAYLPLDPAYPPQRLAFMLEDAGAAALVTDRALADRVPAAGVPVFVLEEFGEELAALPDGDLPDDGADAETAAARLAYVIYTSGSTGLPKGVEVTHGGLANLVAWHRQVYAVGPEDRATLVAGPAFDASVWEVWPYLTAGASLHVPDAETRAAPERLLAWMAAEGATLCFLPTPLAEAAMELPPPAGLALRAVLTGGDRLRKTPPAGLPYRLVNHYGPTENSVVATAGDVRAAGAAPPGRPSPPPAIGRAIANTRLHVLDRDGNPVPVGVAGQLFVSGAGLARGYRRRPDLTAERFLPDPWSAAPGARLYRTGDLVRWRRDGELEFLGRSDNQVKVRGFRIELGEIEAALAAHPDVRAAVVVAREERASGGEKRLVAYVVPQDSASADGMEDSLRAHLAAKLPEYMVPSAFVSLPGLPLTPNGKIDLRALPDPEPAVGAEGHVAPRTPLEELLAGIWAEIVGVPRVGARDHFFRLGGHSLLATQVLSRVRDATGAEVPLATLFEEPVLAGFAHAVEARLRGGAAAGERIPRRPAGVPVPLSFAQERLWFLDRFSPGQSAYNIARAWRLAGPLDGAGLEGALRRIVERHEALRTTFAAEDGQPVQRVSPEPVFDFAFEDLAPLPPEQRAAAAARHAAEVAGRPYDLAAGPLLRAVLLRLGEEEHHLLLGMHHIVSDGWSMARFLDELGAGYAGSALPPLPVQYGDFALWQRRRLTGETLSELSSFWSGQLEGAPGLLELPTDRRRPAVQAFRGDQEAQRLSGPQAEALHELVRGSGATLFMTLAATLAALFHRLSGQPDVVLGTPIAGRTRSELEPLIGFFVNTVPLRARMDDDPPFAALLARMRETTLAAHAHQEMPFEKLVQELAPERSLGHSPIFQVLLALQNTGREELGLRGLQMAPLPLPRAEARFDLELIAKETEEGDVEIVWRYDRDLWDGATVARFAERFAALLAAAAADPARRLSELEVLTAEDRRRLHVDADGGPPVDAGGPALLHRLLEAQVARTPDAVALVHAPAAGAPRVELTYRDLNRRANRLARRLRTLGVGPEARVGVALERSPEMVAALLAVLKAGGAYVPLDPSYPAERLRLMVEDARQGQSSFVLLTQERLLPRLAAALRGQREVEVFCLDRDRLLLAVESEEDLDAAPLSESLSHVIYTSGSTGRPKGVAIEHRAGAAFLGWALTVFSREELAGVFASTSINFDLSVFELFAPLAGGGKVVLGEDALALAATPAAAEVTLVNTVPSAMAELVRMGAVPPGVRTVNLAGEPLRRPLADAIHALPGVERLWNLYGPTEDTTYSTFALVAAGDDAEPAIGRPVAGTRAWVVDRHLRAVAPGVAGELCLAGAGLARGYLRRPELTAEKFVPDPWGAERGEPGARMYRTGDLVRRRAEGALEYLGRLDHQVKVRGFRIELGEIETTLAGHPAVREAAVAAREDEPGEKRLVAYVVPEGGDDAPSHRLSVAELRERLRERLPEFMVPSAFVLLPGLPRTPNGKLDRKALPPPDAAAVASAVYEPPASEEERQIAAVWAEVLGLERVGRRESFFDLGGHSLLATRVVSRLSRLFAVELPLRSLFQEPTVAGLAAAIDVARREGRRETPAITRLARTAQRRPRATT